MSANAKRKMKGWVKTTTSGSAYYHKDNAYHIMKKRKSDWMVWDVDNSCLILSAKTMSECIEAYALRMAVRVVEVK